MRVQRVNRLNSVLRSDAALILMGLLVASGAWPELLALLTDLTHDLQKVTLSEHEETVEVQLANRTHTGLCPR